MDNSQGPYVPLTFSKNVQKKHKKPGSVKFAKFLFVLGILVFIASVFCLVSPLITLVYILVLVLIVIMTLGLLLLNEDFAKMFDQSADFAEFTNILYNISVYTFSISIAFFALSALIMFLSRKKYAPWNTMFTVNIVFIILSVIAILLKVFGLIPTVTIEGV